MTLQNPAAFFLLGLGAVVAVVYFLQRGGKTHEVSALFLWRPEVRAARALRWAWTNVALLLLQLLAVVLLTAALAQPLLPGPASRVQLLALVVDGSASMRAGAGDSQPSKYAKAIDEALQILQRDKPAQVVILQAQQRSRLLAPLTAQADQAARALSQSQPTYEADADWADVVQLLRSQAPLHQYERIVILSDHLPTGPALQNLPVHAVAVGGKTQNAAITAFSARSEPETAFGYALFLSVENFAGAALRTRLIVEAEGDMILTESLDLPSRSRWQRVVNYRGLRTRFTARIDHEDALSHDNVRFAALPQRERIDAAWQGSQNAFLRTALLATGRLRFTEDTNTDDAELRVAYDATIAEEALRGRWLLVNSTWPPHLDSSGEPQVPEAVDFTSPAGDHPVLQHVELSDIVMEAIRPVRFAPARPGGRGAVILARGRLPILYLYEDPDVRLAYLGVDMQKSNLALTVDFPILIRNLLAWLLPSAAQTEDILVGQAFAVEALNRRGLVVREPDGQIHRLASEVAMFTQTDRPGFYRLTRPASAGDEIYWKAVNPPPTESALSGAVPQDRTTTLYTAEASSRVTTASSRFPLWPYAAVLAALVMMLELYAFNPWAMRGLWRRGM